MNTRNVLAIVYFVLTIYSFSGGLVHGVANYPAWKLIRAEDFPAVHKYVNSRIFAVYVPFLFPERRGQHLSDLVSPSCDLHNVGGYDGGS
jgi:hypothetical protein